jgi:hypothetical protein
LIQTNHTIGTFVTGTEYSRGELVNTPELTVFADVSERINASTHIKAEFSIGTVGAYLVEHKW